MKSSLKIAIISGIVAAVIISLALTVHFRLSEMEKSEIESGAEKNEKESPSEIAHEILNSLQNKSENEASESNESGGENEIGEQETPIIINSINIDIQKIDGVYRWANGSEINPIIVLKQNAKNLVEVKNPTDTKHAFIIEQNGKVLLTTKDLESGKTGQISIKPSKTGVFDYHCKYHPDTMKGTLKVEQ